MEGVAAVRRMMRGDSAAVFAVQGECAELAQWGLREYEKLAGRGIAGWVAPFLRQGNQGSTRGADGLRCLDGVQDEGDARGAGGEAVAGFLTARLAADEMEILNLGVRADVRRRGIGRALVDAAFAWGAAHGARRAFLEVRASNAAAIAFYAAFGFAASGRRANYYSAPVEDALRLAVGIG